MGMEYILEINKRYVNRDGSVHQFTTYLGKLLPWATELVSRDEAKRFATAAGARNARRKYLDRYPHDKRRVRVVRAN